jgi:hypothetical protein
VPEQAFFGTFAPGGNQVAAMAATVVWRASSRVSAKAPRQKKKKKKKM